MLAAMYNYLDDQYVCIYIHRIMIVIGPRYNIRTLFRSDARYQYETGGSGLVKDLPAEQEDAANTHPPPAAWKGERYLNYAAWRHVY